MRGRAQLSDVKVGAFVLTALLLLIVLALWLTGSTIGTGTRTVYEVALRDASGLQPGDRVRVAGVSVGRIRHVTLHPGEEWPVLMEIAVKSEILPREDSSAGVATSGLMGSAFLDLRVGSSEAAPLEPGSRIVGRNSGGMAGALEQVEELSGRAVALLDQTSVVLDRVAGDIAPVLEGAEQFLSADNAQEFSSLLSGLRRTVDEVGPRVDTLLARLDGVALQAERTTADLPELADGIGELVDDLRTALGPDGRRLSGALDAVTRTLESTDETVSLVGDNREELVATIRDLRATAANLKSFSQQIKERPSSLIRTKAQPDRRPGDGVEKGR